jgi:hypothetical protein
VNRRSDRTLGLLTEQNDNIPSMEDRVVIDQQQNESWATDIGSHHFDAMSEEAHPIFKDVKLTTMETEQQVTQKMKELELWHQRMGHCSTRTLNETRKCVEAIPALPTNNPFFKCPFCNSRGKMVKKGGYKTTDKDSFIPGQAYHMNLAFVSGPSNLDQQTGSNIAPNPIIKNSQDRYIGFLTIIDVSLRKLWTHPIKNKDLPIGK